MSGAAPWSCEGLALGDRLRGVSLSLEPGGWTTVLGASGAGKSTLLLLFAGLLRPSAGLVGPAPGRLGVAFQEPALWEHLCAERHLRLVGASRADALAGLDRLGLSGLGPRKPGQLSGGQRRRLSLARALAARPAWLLLDEPTAHLDAASRDLVHAELRRARAERPLGVLMTGHDPAEALSLSDRLVLLADGRVLADGPPEAVYRRPASLEAARLLGPAGVLAGVVRRPHELSFTPEAGGDAEVLSCGFVGRGHVLEVAVGSARVLVEYIGPVAPGTRGRVMVREAGV